MKPHLIDLILEALSVLEASGHQDPDTTPAQFGVAFIAIGYRADPFDGGLRHAKGITAHEVSLAQMDMNTEGGVEKALKFNLYLMFINIIGIERDRRGQDSIRDTLSRRQLD